jgi:Phasin protein
MSNRYQVGEAGKSYAEQNQHVFFGPAAALSMWTPFLAHMLKGNANAQEGFGTIATEWRGFVSHRLQEDLTLTQRLSHCRTAEQILAAYTEFWRKAVEDYGKEVTSMTKLVTGVTRNMALAAPSLAEENRAKSYASEKAAA